MFFSKINTDNKQRIGLYEQLIFFYYSNIKIKIKI